MALLTTIAADPQLVNLVVGLVAGVAGYWLHHWKTKNAVVPVAGVPAAVAAKPASLLNGELTALENAVLAILESRKAQDASLTKIAAAVAPVPPKV